MALKSFDQVVIIVQYSDQFSLPFKVGTFKAMAQLTPNWVAQLTRLKLFESYSISTCYDGLIGAQSLGFISKPVLPSTLDKLE